LLSALAVGVLTLGVAERDALAIGQATGRITGVVTEATSQAPVPGAAVTVSGGSGFHQKSQTGEDGSLQILAVPPGTYDLLLTYEGMRPLKRKVVVNPDAATPVNIVWSAEAAQEETTVVEEERHLTNPDSPQTGQIYSTERQNQLPMTRQYQAVANQIPGVVTVSSTNPNVKGARSNNNRYFVNGLDLTDPVNNTSAAQFQQDAVESVQVSTGGFEAKYNALGAIVAVQTERGTNQFHGSSSVYWAPTQLVEYDTFGAYAYNEAKPWDYNAQKPEQGRYDLNLNAQGPIIKDHLFFNAGVQYSRSNAVQPAGPPRFVQAPSAVFESVYVLGGITFVPTDSHRFHIEGFADPSTRDYDGNIGSSANSTHPYSQTGLWAGGRRATLEWAWQASKHITTKVMLGTGDSHVDSSPQGLRGIEARDLEAGVPYDFHRPAHSNRDDGTSWYNTGPRSDSRRRRIQLDASVTATFEAAGKHEAEFGVQSAYIEQNLKTTFPGGPNGPDDQSGFGVSYTDQRGGPLQTGLCDVDPYINPAAAQGIYTGNGCFQRRINRSYAAHQSGNTFGVYLQDRYKPVRWLTILPGIRWDTGTVRADDSTISATAYGFGPRLSFIADVTNDQKTIAQISYGRMTEMPALRWVSDYDESRRNTGYVEQYNANTRQFEFQQTTGGVQASRIDFSHKPATADEILLSARREIANGVLARVDYTYRYFQRQFEQIEVNTLLDPTGTRTIGYANGVPTRITQYGFTPLSSGHYSGVDFMLETRVKNLEVQGGYTLSQSWGPQGSGGFDNARMLPYLDAYQANVDTRHQIKTATTVKVFNGFTIGLIINWRSGVALAKTYGSNEPGIGSIRRTPSGYEPGAYFNTGTGNPGQNGTYSDVRSWTEFRSPDLLTANLMLGYDFYQLLGQHFTLNAQVTNVLALERPTSISTAEGSPQSNLFGTVSGRQAFRTVQLGARYEF
jgi:hypothetical protein